MGKWLDAARAAKQETVDIKHADIPDPVQLVQKVHLITEAIGCCTKCTNCTAPYINRTDKQPSVPDEWKTGYERLISVPVPNGITAPRWQQFIQDAATFMCCWSEKAYALGWTTLDVFGVHSGAPAQRPDAAGLIWLLNGNEIAAITADKAIIKTMTGNSQTLIKGVSESVVAWSFIEVVK